MTAATLNTLDPRTLGDMAMRAMSEEQPHAGSMEDFAGAADLVDKLGQATTKGEMLALVLAYRRDVREQVLAARTPAAPLGTDDMLVPSDAMSKVLTARALEHSLHDYWVAPTDEGPLAYTWKDKPHRLLYDLIAALRFYSQDGGRIVPTKPAELAPSGHGSWAVQQAFIEGANWRHRSQTGSDASPEDASLTQVEAERRYGVIKEDARFKAVVDLGVLALTLGWDKEPDTDLAVFLRARLPTRLISIQKAADFNEFVEKARQSGRLAWTAATINEWGHEDLYVRGFIDALMKHAPDRLPQATA